MAACNVGVLVPEPANSPSAKPRSMPIVLTNRRLTAPADSTPTSANRFAFCPLKLANPRKNCLP